MRTKAILTNQKSNPLIKQENKTTSLSNCLTRNSKDKRKRLNCLLSYNRHSLVDRIKTPCYRTLFPSESRWEHICLRNPCTCRCLSCYTTWVWVSPHLTRCVGQPSRFDRALSSFVSTHVLTCIREKRGTHKRACGGINERHRRDEDQLK